MLSFESVDTEVVFVLQYFMEATWIVSSGGRHYHDLFRSAV